MSRRINLLRCNPFAVALTVLGLTLALSGGELWAQTESSGDAAGVASSVSDSLGTREHGGSALRFDTTDVARLAAGYTFFRQTQATYTLPSAHGGAPPYGGYLLNREGENVVINRPLTCAGAYACPTGLRFLGGVSQRTLSGSATAAGTFTGHYIVFDNVGGTTVSTSAPVKVFVLRHFYFDEDEIATPLVLTHTGASFSRVLPYARMPPYGSSSSTASYSLGVTPGKTACTSHITDLKLTITSQYPPRVLTGTFGDEDTPSFTCYVRYQMLDTSSGRTGADAVFDLEFKAVGPPLFDPAVRAPLTYTVGSTIYNSEGVRYTTPFNIRGTSPVVLWKGIGQDNIQSGSLPPGMSVSNSRLVDTPTAAGDDYFVRRRIRDLAVPNRRSGYYTVPIVVLPAPTAGTVPDIHITASGHGSSGSNVNFALPTISGGQGPFSAKLMSPSLPANMSIVDGTTRNPRLVGTPAMADISAGPVNYVVVVTDSNNVDITSQFTVHYYTPPRVVSALPPMTHIAVGNTTTINLPWAVGGRGVMAANPTFAANAVYVTQGTWHGGYEARSENNSGYFPFIVRPSGESDVRFCYRLTDLNGARTGENCFNVRTWTKPYFTAAELETLAGGYTFRQGVQGARRSYHLPDGLPASAFANKSFYNLTDGASGVFTDAAYNHNNISFNSAFFQNLRTTVNGATAPTGTRVARMHFRRSFIDDTASANTNIVVVAPMQLAAVIDYDLPLGRAASIQFAPAVNTPNVGDFVYAITGVSGATLPNGITFDPAARQLNGTPPNAVARQQFEYSVRDTWDDITARVTFALTISPPPAFDYTPTTAALSFTLGASSFTINTDIVSGRVTYAATGGVRKLTYRGQGALPSGVNALFDASGASIGGVAAVGSVGNYQYTFVVTDEAGVTDSVRLNIHVTAIPTFTATQGKIDATLNGASTEVTLPSADGGIGGLTYSLAPSLPVGFTFDEAARIVSGIATANADIGDAQYTLTAHDSLGAIVSTKFNLEIHNPLVFLSENPTALTYTINLGRSIPVFSAAGGGFGALTYTLDGLGDIDRAEVRQNLRFDVPTRTLRGAFIAGNSGQVTLTYIVTDALNSRLVHLVELFYVDRPIFTEESQAIMDDYVVRADFRFEITLPPAEGGSAPLVYALHHNLARTTFPSTSESVMLLTTPATTTAATRDSFTADCIATHPTPPTTHASAQTLSFQYWVRDSAGATSTTTFSVRVTGKIRLAAEQGDLQFGINQAVDLQLPPAVDAIRTTAESAETYSLIDIGGGAANLPSGVTFDAENRRLAGTTPGVGVAVQTYIYSATDVDDNPNRNIASTTFALQVINATLSPTAFSPTSLDVTYTLGSAAQYSSGGTTGGALTLPAASGDYTRAYRAEGALPTGMSVSTPDGEEFALIDIAAPPSTVGDFTYRRIVTDQLGETTFSLYANIVAAPAFSGTQADMNLNLNQSLSVNLPTASGYGGVVYSITPPLPNGLTLDASTALLSGTPTAVAEALHTLTATDVHGVTAGVQFNLRVRGPVFYSPTSIAATFTVGEAANYSSGGATLENLTLPQALSGLGARSYSVEGALPTGMSVATPAGEEFAAIVVANKPTTAGDFTYTRIADDTVGQATFALYATVVSAPVFIGQPPPAEAVFGEAADIDLQPAIGGFGGLVYSLTPTLPSGLIFDANSVNISGLPTNLSDLGAVDYTLRAVDAHGVAAESTVRLSIFLPLAFVEGNNPVDLTYTVGDTAKTVDFLALQSGGRTPYTYSLEGLAPLSAANTLTFVGDSRQLRGGFSAANNSAVLTYIAADSGGAAVTHLFTIAAVPAPNFSDSDVAELAAGLSFRVNAAIDATLPSAEDGAPPLTHNLTAGAASTYEPTAYSANGISVDIATRVLSGTAPSTPQASALRWHARDANGVGVATDAPLVFAAAPTLSQINIDLLGGATGIAVQLAAAANIVGDAAYTLTDLDGVGLDDLPSGVLWNANTRRLTGDVPSESSTAQFIYGVADDFDSVTAAATFTLQVTNIPTPIFTPPQLAVTFTQSHAGVAYGGMRYNALTLPAATSQSGDAVLEYTLSASFAGLTTANIGGGQVQIGGTPTAAGDFTFVRTVRDSRGSRNATFSVFAHIDAAPNFDGAAFMTAHATSSSSSGVPSNALTFAGSVVDVQLPVAIDGAGGFVYSLSPPLPAGVTLDAATAQLSGTPTGGAGNRGYTLTATDAVGASVNYVFNFRVHPAFYQQSGAWIVDQTYDINQFAFYSDRYVPTGRGGYTPCSRSFPHPTGFVASAFSNIQDFSNSCQTPSNNNRARMQLFFNVEQPRVQATFAVTDRNGVRLEYLFHVSALPRVNWPQAAKTELASGYIFRVDSAAEVTLPGTEDGRGPNAFRLTEVGDNYDDGISAPPGMTLDAATRILSGTPTAAGEYNRLLWVRDARNHRESAPVKFIQFGGLALPQKDVHFSLGASVSLDLAAAQNAIESNQVSYSLTALSGSALPDGISANFGIANRRLSGVPASVTSPQTFVYSAEELTDGASTSVTFTISVVAPASLPNIDTVYGRIGTSLNVDLALASGGASPHTYSLTVGAANAAFVDNASIAGVSITQDIAAGEFALTGAPTAAADTALTLHVRDALGGTDSTALTLSVASAITLGSDFLMVYVGDAVDQTLSQAGNIRDGANYALTADDASKPSLQSVNLAYTASTRAISGTPSGVYGEATFTHSVVDAIDKASRTAKMRIIARRPTDLGASELAYAFAIGGGREVVLPSVVHPSAEYYAPLNYSLSALDGNALPSWLTYSATASATPITFGTRGEANAQAARQLVYAVVDDGGNVGTSGAITFSVAASNAPQINLSALSFTIGQTVDLTFTAEGFAVGGQPPYIYTLSGVNGATLPRGLAFDANSGVLSNTISVTSPTLTTHTLVATDSGNLASVATQFTIQVFAKPTFSVTQGELSFTANTAGVQFIEPATLGAGVLTYSLPASGETLISGLTFEAAPPRLSNAASIALGAATYTITAHDINDITASQQTPLIVVAEPTFALESLSRAFGQLPVNFDLPRVANGASPIAYAVSGATPSGITYDAATHQLRGAAIQLNQETQATLTATDANGATATLPMTLSVAPPPVFADVAEITFTLGTATTAVLPLASGVGAITYAFTNTPPSWISVTPSAASSLVPYTFTATASRAASGQVTYTASDGETDETTTLLINVRTIAAPNFATAQATLSFTAGNDNTFTVTAASDGAGELIYAMPSPPAGIVFDAASRELRSGKSVAATALANYVIDRHR